MSYALRVLTRGLVCHSVWRPKRAQGEETLKFLHVVRLARPCKKQQKHDGWVWWLHVQQVHRKEKVYPVGFCHHGYRAPKSCHTKHSLSSSTLHSGPSWRTSGYRPTFMAAHASLTTSFTRALVTIHGHHCQITRLRVQVDELQANARLSTSTSVRSGHRTFFHLCCWRRVALCGPFSCRS